MSGFKINAKHLKSGNIHSVWCLDDYFGRHKYGYIPNEPDAKALTEDQFYMEYEVEEPK